MLASLQKHIVDIYSADSGHQVADFLITDKALADHIGDGAIAAGVEETVFVAEDDDGMAVSVYLDHALMSRLKSMDPLNGLRPAQLNDLTTVIEGISHFNYLAWNANHDRSVTLLELELQAEVDKFVATTLMALEQNDLDFARELHRWLFDEVCYQTSLDSEQRERYATANDYASRFCHRILDRIDEDSGILELRDFYRFSQGDKIGYIHSLAWE